MGIFDWLFGGREEDQQQNQQTTQNQKQNQTEAEKSSQQTGRTQSQTSQTQQQVTQEQKLLQALNEQANRSREEATTGSAQQNTLDAGVQQILKSLVPQLAGAVSTPDVEQLVSGARAGAIREFDSRISPEIQAMMNQIGGSARTNSASALLKLRGEEDLAARLAGVESSTRMAASEQASTNLARITELLKGANIQTAQRQTTEETSVEDLLRNLNSTTTGKTSGTTREDVSGQSQETQNREVLSMIEALLNSAGTSAGSGSGSTSGNLPTFLSALGSLGGFTGPRN